MQTEQEYFYKMINMLEKLEKGDYCLTNCYGCCGDGKISITCPNVVFNFIQALHRTGYGDVSEYKAEIERLKEVVKNYKEVLCETTQRKDDAIKRNDVIVEEYENKIKQAQVDVLNKVKEHLFFGVGLSFLRLYVDELIQEVENDN